MESRFPILSRCSSKPQRIGPLEGGEDPVAARPEKPRPNKGVTLLKPIGKGKGVAVSKVKAKRPQKGAASSSSSSSTISSSSSRQQQQKRRDHGGLRDDNLQDLALPLGMSFAAIVSQVLDRTNTSQDQLSVEQLSLICIAAVKESVSNIYGHRFDLFLLNFEKSFCSTLRTLRLIISETNVIGRGNRSSHHVSVGQGNPSVNEPTASEQVSMTCSSFMSGSMCENAPGNCEIPTATLKEFEEDLQPASMNNQLILQGQINQQLARSSPNFVGSKFSESIVSTFEKSVMEQTRSNDLKAFEIGLIMKKLQFKESQLAINSYANMLEKMKIFMGISKFQFKEEKLKNQMLDVRHGELIRRCIDLLITGMIIMCGCLVYGAFVYSYHRITEATSSCSATPKESKSWWIPKPVASVSSGWLMLRCHFVALTRMSFGLLVIVAIAYSMVQRSATSRPTAMPVTFILLMLGCCCGLAGKLCIDTLGGSGLRWLLHWETLCMLHFFANVFPGALYYVLYGPISVSQGEAKAGRLIPYSLRRYVFYFTLLFVLPSMAGLLPFASLGEWREHIIEKITGV